MASVPEGIPAGRVHSIDALRGFDMFWIVGGGTLVERILTLMHTPEAITRQFEHSAWNGFTFEDLIFPLFLFIAGLTVPFSLVKRSERGDSKRGLVGHILKRVVILFALGLVYNGILDFRFADMRWVGVLQRIALAWGAAALIAVFFRTVRAQAIWAGAILVGYWAVMMLVPVPGFGAGVLTPEGNLASFVDRLVLPGRFCCFDFGDNEGVLSTIPAVATALLGVLAGNWLRGSRSGRDKTIGLLAAGVASLIAAIIWGLAFPINKLLWTSSYVLFAAGWSLLLLAVFFWIIDVKGWKKWSFFFTVIGMNSITIYVASDLFDFRGIANVFIHGFIGNMGAFAPAFTAFSVLAVKWLLLWFLYRQKIFLRV